jgi:hypothetical protein
MNRKLVGIGASSVILVIVAAVAAITLSQPTPQIEEVVQKPKFHPFNARFQLEGNRIYFDLQNIGNVTATQINITITVEWNQYIRVWDRNNNTILAENATAFVPKLESKEANNFFAQILYPAGGQRYVIWDGVNNPVSRYIFYIVCAEKVQEKIVLPV